jgi:predicted dehydrogenase
MHLDRSGGVLFDLGVHDFDWLRWTLGEVETVVARSVLVNGSVSETDYALATLEFESGAVAHVELTWMDPTGFRTSFEVCGSDGMIEFDSRRAATLRTTLAGGGTMAEGPLAPWDDPFRRQLQAFIDWVQRGVEPVAKPIDGVKAVAIAEAALQSAKTGALVKPATV